MKKQYKAVDLFCGAGGMSLGLEMAGYNISLGLDFVKDCEDTHNLNFPNVPFICGDITDVSGADILIKTGLKKGDLTLVSGGLLVKVFLQLMVSQGFLRTQRIDYLSSL